MVAYPSFLPAAAARLARNRGPALLAGGALAFGFGANAAILLVVFSVAGAGGTLPVGGANAPLGALRAAVDAGLGQAAALALAGACCGLFAAGRRMWPAAAPTARVASDLLMLGGIGIAAGALTAMRGLALMMNLADVAASHGVPAPDASALTALAVSAVAGLLSGAVVPVIRRLSAARGAGGTAVPAWPLRAALAGGVALSIAVLFGIGALFGIGTTVAHGGSTLEDGSRAGQAPMTGGCAGHDCAPAAKRCPGSGGGPRAAS
jgi:hypothetical protein